MIALCLFHVQVEEQLLQEMLRQAEQEAAQADRQQPVAALEQTSQEQQQQQPQPQ
jgi:hypothetical protein